MFKGFQIIFILAFLSIRLSVYGQACCSGGVPLSGSLDITNIPAGNLDIRLIYDYNFQNALFSGSHKLDDHSRSRTTHSLLFRSGISFSEKIALYTMFSVIQQEELNKNPASGNDFFTKAFGFGDMVLAFQCQPISDSRSGLILASGLKIPVGSTGVVQEETGIPLNPDMQPGSGSWDGLFLMNFDQKGLFKTSLGFSLNASFRLTSRSFRFNHQIAYRFGNEFQLTTGFIDNRLLKGVLIYPHILVKYRFTGKDQTNGMNTPNTGGHWLYLLPGASIFFSPKIGLTFHTELPVYRDLSGTQLTTSFRIHSSFIYRVSLKKKGQRESPVPGI